MPDASAPRPPHAALAALRGVSGMQSVRSPAGDVEITPGDCEWLRVMTMVFVQEMSAADAAVVLGNAQAGVSSWAAIESLLSMHRCGGIAYRLLSMPDVRVACAPPEETVDWLRATYLVDLAQTFGEPAVVRQRLDALAAAGVPALVIKGLAVGAWIYGDPVLRQHSDIDLIVPETRAETAHEVLIREGYEQASGPFDNPRPFYGPPLCRGESLGTVAYQSLQGGPAIDLSFDPLRVFWRPCAGTGDPFAGWWARRQVVAIGGVALPTLGPEDQFLQLARHLQFHDYSRLVWFVDLLLLLRAHGERLDWDLVGREARAHGIEAALFRTLELADSAYGVRIPAPAWRALRPNPLERSLHRLVWPDVLAYPRDRRKESGNPLSPRMLGAGGTRQVLGFLLLVLNRHRGRNVRYLARRAFPSQTWLRAVYGDTVAHDASYLALLRFHRRALRGRR